jgi:hypothetical protein
VKLLSADDSVGPPHVKVGHCQALIQTLDTKVSRVFSLWRKLFSPEIATKSCRYLPISFYIRV